MQFELVGTLVALAIYNAHTLELAFPMLIYRCVAPLPCACTTCTTFGGVFLPLAAMQHALNMASGCVCRASNSLLVY